MKTILKTTMAVAVASVLFTGCSVDDLEDNSSSNSSSSSSSYSDVISISKTNKDFKVTWIKNNTGYGEVIYQGSAEDTYAHKALTDNGSGIVTWDCEFYSDSNDEAVYNCNASNLVGDLAWKTIYMKESVQYQWYPTYGYDHEEGEVDATTEYRNGVLIVE